MRFAASLLVALIALVAASSACTVVYVGPGASVTGSSFVGHSSDGGASTDPRLVYIPAGDKPAAARNVYPSPESYPRYVGFERGAEPYFPQPGQKSTKPLGSVPLPAPAREPQAYMEDTYGAANAFMGTGEATCSAVYVAAPVDEDGGRALLSIDELSRIALERAYTAAEAVALMGALAEEHGFYGPGSFEGSGESLIVADPDEGWVFHILPDSTGTSAIWAAKRVPRDHVTVVANMFIIRDIAAPADAAAAAAAAADGELSSSNLRAAAAERGCLASPAAATVDFTGCFSGGEYAHKYYSGRRVWRAYDLLAPEAGLSPEYGNLLKDKPYPFSLRPAKKVELKHVFAVYRDYLEGTDYSLTQGPAAGPFGTPDRYTGGPGEREFPNGWWERPIGLFRTGDTYVTELRGYEAGVPRELAAVLWYGPHAPHGTVFQPFFPALPSVPASYEYGHQRAFNRSTAFWAHRTVLNLAQIKYKYIIEDVKAAQRQREANMEAAVRQWTRDYEIGQITAAQLARETRAAADETVAQWWQLADDIMFKYADGFVSADAETSFGKSVGYPAWWLKLAGYDKPPATKLAGAEEGLETEKEVVYPPLPTRRASLRVRN